MDLSTDFFEPILPVGLVARRIGVSVETVRMYERKGLILPHRTNSGRRMYSLHDLERLHDIRKLITEHGLNLNGIKLLMSLVFRIELKGGLDDACVNCPVYYEAVQPCSDTSNEYTKCQNKECQDYPVCIATNWRRLIKFVHKYSHPDL